MTVAFVFSRAVENYRQYLAEQSAKAIQESNKATDLLFRIIRDPRFMITADPPTTVEECIKLFTECGLDWNDFIPFYEQALREEKED